MLDNEVAYGIALDTMNHADEECGRQILLALRDHIRKCQETKSIVHLLPHIEVALESCLRKIQTMTM